MSVSTSDIRHITDEIEALAAAVGSPFRHTPGSPAHKAADGGERVIAGWASRSEPDAMGDVIPVTAWTPECLAEYMQRPALFYSHRRHERIGSVIAVEPQYDDAARTSGGLWAEAKLFDAGSTQRSDEVWNMLNQTPSAHFGMSIGFRPLKSEPFENGGSEIGVLKLHEISIVSLPAAHLADVVEVRERAEEIEHVLMDDTGTWLRQLEDRGMDSRGAERALGCAIAACKTIAADADDYDERRATMLAESKRHPWERCAEATLHPAQVLAAAGWGSDQRLPDSAIERQRFIEDHLRRVLGTTYSRNCAPGINPLTFPAPRPFRRGPNRDDALTPRE